jgi:hypothetical protein
MMPPSTPMRNTFSGLTFLHPIPQWVSFEVSHTAAKLDFILKTMFLNLLREYMIMWYLLQSFRVNFAKCMYCCIPHINSFTTEEWNH